MLLANMAVAKKISSSYPEAALLRRHPPPLMKTLDATAEMLAKEGIELDMTTAGSLHASLEAIQDPLKQMLARLLMIKGMKRADYFCTGSVDISTFSHYALSVPLYTHFTSPIRRYCDLVVHRLLDSALKGEKQPFTTETMRVSSERCNVRKFASKDAQDASQKLFLCAYLWKIQHDTAPDGIIADAHVNQVGTRAFDVIVPKYGIETRVWLEDSLELGEIGGIESDEENNKVTIHWKREIVDDNLVADESDAVTGVDRSKYFTQIVGMFDSVRVRIVADVQKSPPSLKLFAVRPS
jgi:protein SSD1